MQGRALGQAALLWLVCVQGKVCLTEYPLHAIETDITLCAWECAPGFYHAGTTCRACSSELLGCPAGWLLQPCTQNTDTLCVQCPPPLAGQRYTQSGCNVTECDDGYFYRASASDCLICQEGFYCAQSTRQVCPENCTITQPGATSILQCSNTEDEIVFTVNFIIMLSIAAVFERCPLLDGLVTYGTFFGCTVAYSTDTLGSLKCQMSTAACVADSYKEWLSGLLLNQTSSMQQRLRECLQSPELRLGGLTVVRATTRSVSSSRKNEKLEFPKQPWGVARVEVANALGLFLLVDFMLLLLFIGLVGYCCYAMGAKRRVAAAYKRMMRRR